MYAGYKVKLGDGSELIVPPLSLGQLRSGLLAALKKHDERSNAGAELGELLVLRSDIILEAVKRNYPDFTQERLEAFLDMGNIQAVWLAVLGMSGFRAEDVAPGEAQAAKTPGT